MVEAVLVVSIWAVAVALAVGVALQRWRLRGGVGATVLFLAGGVVMVAVGFLLLFLRDPGSEAAQQGVLVVSLGLASFAVGASLGGLRLPIEAGVAALVRGLDARNRGQAVRVGTAVLAIVAFYYVLLGRIPLIEGVLQFGETGFRPGLLNTLRTTRDSLITGDPSSAVPLTGLFDIVRYFAAPAVLLMFVGLWRSGNPRWRPAAAGVAVSGLLIAGTGQRWPILYAVGGLLVLSGLETDTGSPLDRHAAELARRAPMKRRRPVALVVAAIGSVVALSALLGRTLETSLSGPALLLFALQDLGERVIYGGVLVPFASYSEFAGRPFLLGASWLQNLAAYAPGPTPSYPVVFYQEVTGSSIGYTAPPDFFTEAWLNFGWPGVVLLSAIWGRVLDESDRCVFGSHGAKASHLSRAVLAVLLASVAFTYASGAVFAMGATIGVAVLWLLRLIDGVVIGAARRGVA